MEKFDKTAAKILEDIAKSKLMPTNNQEKWPEPWIEKLITLIQKEKVDCSKQKDCYINDIIGLVREEIRKAKQRAVARVLSDIKKAF